MRILKCSVTINLKICSSSVH